MLRAIRFRKWLQLRPAQYRRIACYRVDVNQAARIVVRKTIELAGSGATTRTTQAMMPDFFPGESVAKR